MEEAKQRIKWATKRGELKYPERRVSSISVQLLQE